MAAKFCLGLIFMLLVVSTIASPELVGGAVNISPDRADVQNAAKYAVEEFNTKSKDDYVFEYMKVLSAQSQVVAGIKYYLEVQIGKTQCRKDATNNAQSCNKDVTQIFVCNFQVWDVPWLNQRTLLNSSCEAQ